MNPNNALSTHAPIAIPSQRLMTKVRTCKDCAGAYSYTDTHQNPRHCPGCLPNHSRHCRICRAPFHPALDTDRLCPVHVTHPALF